MECLVTKAVLGVYPMTVDEGGGWVSEDAFFVKTNSQLKHSPLKMGWKTETLSFLHVLPLVGVAIPFQGLKNSFQRVYLKISLIIQRPLKF